MRSLGGEIVISGDYAGGSQSEGDDIGGEVIVSG